MTVRELRRHRAVAPGGSNFTDLVQALLPLVFGVTKALLPEPGAAAEPVVVGAFDAFARGWRKLPRRTVVATWLLRTTWFAARHERRRLGLPWPTRGSPAGVDAVALRALIGLRPGLLNALVIHRVIDASVPEISRALRCGEARALARGNRALARLDRRLRRKLPGVDPRSLLARLARPAPPELETSVLTQLGAWSPRVGRSELVRSISRSWRWLELRRALRRVGTAFAVSCVALVLAVVGTISLAKQGYLIPWFVQQSSRRLAKEMPELVQPGRPWPSGTEEATTQAALPPPRAPGELFSLTSVWTATLSFTPRQWRDLAPTRVPPVPNMMQPDGKMILRNPRARRSGLAGVMGLEFNWVMARLQFAGEAFSPVGVRYRGNGTYVNSLFGPKQSLKVDLDKFSRGQQLVGVHTLNFVNAIPDDSYLHDALAQQLFRDLGLPAPRTAFAYLTLDVPGKFARQPLGLYVLIENVDADFAADRFGSRRVPVFKPVTTDLFAFLGEDWAPYADIYDLKTEATPQQLDRVIEFARLVSQADDAEFARELAGLLDLEGFAGFLAGHVLMASYDGFLSNGQNFYLYLDPRSNRFGFVPWDQDHGWGEFGYVASADRRERASIWEPSTYRNRFLERVLKVEAFRALYRQRLEQALDGPFSVERLFPRIDHLGSVIRSAVAAESEFRLKRFDVALSTNWVAGSRDGAPEGPRSRVHQIKRFIPNRIESVRDQLAGRTQGEVLLRKQ